jgi:hypothetical protein
MNTPNQSHMSVAETVLAEVQTIQGTEAARRGRAGRGSAWRGIRLEVAVLGRRRPSRSSGHRAPYA